MAAVAAPLVKAPPFNIPVPFRESASVAAPVRENPFISSAAPNATDVPPPVVPKGPLVATAEEAPSFSVPAEIVVTPV